MVDDGPHRPLRSAVGARRVLGPTAQLLERRVGLFVLLLDSGKGIGRAELGRPRRHWHACVWDDGLLIIVAL